MSFLIWNHYKNLFDEILENMKIWNPAPKEIILTFKKYAIFNLVIAISDLVILVILVYIAYRVIAVTKCENKTITCMIILLNLTILADLCKTIYYANAANLLFTDYNYYEPDKAEMAIIYKMPNILL